MATDKSVKTAGNDSKVRAATQDEINKLANEQTDEPSEEVWKTIQTGKLFYIAEKCFNKTLEGFLIGSEMNNLDTDRPFLTYQVLCTVPIELSTIDGEAQQAAVGDKVSIVATSGLKGELQAHAMDPDAAIKVKMTALRKRDISKGRKYIDYRCEWVTASKVDDSPKKFPRAQIGHAAMLPAAGMTSAASELMEAGA